jgi:hypothetical protein
MPVNETTERIIFEGVDKISAASKSAEASTKALKDTISSVKNILGALGVTVGAGAFIKLQLDTLHATAALKDRSFYQSYVWAMFSEIDSGALKAADIDHWSPR